MKQMIDFSLQLTQQMLRLCSRIEPLINSQINTISKFFFSDINTFPEFF